MSSKGIAVIPSNKVRCRNLDPLRFVIKDIKQGNTGAVVKALDSSPELSGIFRARLMAERVPKGRSPLVTASQYNRIDLLHYILENYQANLEQETSTDIEGGHPVEGATPLWTASTLGHIDIVSDLIRRGANIEHTTDSRSSPLRGAAFDGHLDVVKYLIERGADIDKPNQVGQSPLTIAAAMKKEETVKYLLEKKANIHHKGHNGDTPLHVAVESGSSEITKLLVEAGAKNIPNDVGYTPAIMACCYGHQDIMNYLNSTFVLDHQELYDCYCLLVAKEVLSSDLVAAMDWLLKAVEVRNAHPSISKELDKRPLQDIYDKMREPSTETEARTILGNNMESFFLCAMYCERVLGAIHPTTPFYIRISGDMALEESRHDKCMQLWLRSLEFDNAARMAYELQIIEDLLFSVRGFCSMLDAGYVPQIHQHFQWGVKEFKMARESKISEVDVAYCLCRMLAVWFKVLEHSPDKYSEERKRLDSAVRTLVSLMEGKETPLLVACLYDITGAPKTNNAITSVANAKLPLHSVVEVLIENGCPVNCEDSIGNFPLHLAVKLKEDSSLECVKTLIEYGAHLDAVNHCNESALSLAKKKEGHRKNNQAIIDLLTLSLHRDLSLQCISAAAIVKEGLNYVGVLPAFLTSFVSEHDTDGLVAQESEEEGGGLEEESSISTTDSSVNI